MPHRHVEESRARAHLRRRAFFALPVALSTGCVSLAGLVGGGDGGSPDGEGASRDAADGDATKSAGRSRDAGVTDATTAGDSPSADARRETSAIVDATADRTTPITLVASGQANPGSLAVDLPNAYWVNQVPDGSVMTAPVTGTGDKQPTALASGQPSPFSLVLAPPLVYFSNDNENLVIMSVPMSGGTVVNVFGSGLNASDRWLAQNSADPSHLYWTNIVAGHIYEGTMSNATYNAIVTSLSSPEQLVADSTGLYWVDQGSNDVMRATLDGGAVTTLAAHTTGPTYLAVNATQVYWTATTAGEVRYAPKAGAGSLTPGSLVSSGEVSPAGIALDSSYVYWANEGDGRIRRAPMDGGPAVDLATDQMQPTSVVVVSGIVYWTNIGDGTIRSVPAP